MLRRNGEAGIYPMHMPGHKRAMEWKINPYAYDITEIGGFDDLHKPSGVLAELNGRIAARYGADEAFLTVNGSTSGVMTAISAAVKPGGTILLDRGSHRSAYGAVFLRRLGAEYVYPRLDAETGIGRGISAADVEKKLNGSDTIRAVHITSPTYEGAVSDIPAIAAAAHAHGLPLIVDAAHGAHFGLYGGFPDSPVSQGADAVIMSLHKTLPAFTQTAVICIRGDRIKAGNIRRYFNLYVSTSPSYLLMASAERCMDFLDERGAAAFEEYGALLRAFRSKCETLERLYLWRPAGVYDFDEGKLVICTDRSGISGPELAGLLRSRYSVETELTSARYVIAMTSCMDKAECYDRLWTALREIDSECAGAPPKADGGRAGFETGAGTDGGKASFETDADVTKVCEAWETEGMESEERTLEEAVGRAAAEYIYVYPPGVPWLVPGERITERTARRIREYRGGNIEVRGLTSAGGMRVLTEK